MDDEEFFRKYEAYEREVLLETIQYLIEQKQKSRDEKLARLKKESSDLLKRLDKINKQQITEEIQYLREIISLHRHLKF